MVDHSGRWYPDWLGQQPHQDPAYMRYMNQMQQTQQVSSQPAQQQTGSPRESWISVLLVPNEDVARNYFVPPGTSTTFMDENSPYCYVKTAGSSPLENVKFEKIRLTKEDDPPNHAQPAAQPASTEFDKLWNEMMALRTEVVLLASKINNAQDHHLNGGDANEPSPEWS